jgi:hypothetical protein
VIEDATPTSLDDGLTIGGWPIPRTAIHQGRRGRVPIGARAAARLLSIIQLMSAKSRSPKDRSNRRQSNLTRLESCLQPV